MKVHFFFRKFHSHQISVEKLFQTIIGGIKNLGIETENFINPYPLTIFGILKALFFFKKNQGQINHITGDIHWSCLLLDAKKTILTIHDLVGLRQYSDWRSKMYYLFWIYFPLKKLKYVTVISDKTKKEITDIAPWAEHKIRVIPNCLTTPIKKENAENFFQDKLNLLIVGTRSNKNVERMLEAVVGLPLNITIIGDLSEAQKKIINIQKIAIINKKEISDDELLEEYSRANILLFASLYEGFGLPILEAQSQNCCVITSDLSPMKEVAGSGAVLVDPFDVSSIKSALEELIKNPEKRQELIITGKSNIERFSVEKISSQYVALYQEISSNIYGFSSI
jgi:glycosyltransferase involved in cell wall biosynthesis